MKTAQVHTTSSVDTEAGSKNISPLTMELFRSLDKENIRYCHWKSNEHLLDALEGKTDLDLLIHPEDKKDFQKITLDCGFLSARSPWEKRFAGLEDYLAVDPQTGALLHLHVHYKVLLGEKYIKNHCLPLIDLFFEHLTRKHEVPVPIPEIELLILIIRAHMKLSGDITTQDSSSLPYPDAISEELQTLYQQIDAEKFWKIYKASGISLSESLIQNFLNHLAAETLTASTINEMRREVFSAMRPYERLTGVSRLSFKLLCTLYNSDFYKKVFGKRMKHIDSKGLSVALIGADGAGKTTFTKAIRKWFGKKLPIKTFYLGIPKKKFLVYYLNELSRYVKRKEKKAEKKETRKKLKDLCELIRAIRWVIIARYRYRQHNRMKKESQKGFVCISDRYPMKEFWTMNEPMDGPRIAKMNRPWLSRLQKMEESYYLKISPPDRLFILQVPYSVLEKRKPPKKPELLEEKAKYVNNILPREGVIPLNGDQPMEQTLSKIQVSIWEEIV